MSEYIGSRISLISKSGIRYAGTLHQIDSEEATISLENVRSYGTEDRETVPEKQIGPSDQVYEYIIFRGSDVRDLRIDQQPPVKENKPPPMPSDPAILGARPRPQGPKEPSPQPQQSQSQSQPQSQSQQQQQPAPTAAGPAYPQPGPPHFNNYYGPPPPATWGRGAPGPIPGPPFGNMPYPPPPGWFPPGQGFPPGPGGPGPWGPNYPYPPGVPMPMNQQQGQSNRATPSGAAGSDAKQQAAPGAPAGQQEKAATTAQPPTEPKSLGQGAPKPQQKPAVTPTEAKAPKSTIDATGAVPKNNIQKTVSPQPESIPTGPKNNRITPAIPTMPKPFQVPASMAGAQSSSSKPAGTAAAGTIQDATEAARAAVALAMAKISINNNEPQAQAQSQSQAPNQNQTPGPPMDNLTTKVNEMRVNAVRAGHSGRGRGRGGRPGHRIEVPDSDFDFASSNAKFNKEDVVKEAIAGSPLVDNTDGDVTEAKEPQAADSAASAQAYDKTRSFFDNISSEAKDRAGSGGQKPGGREWRGEEQRRNMETFGQGSVDGGYRNYRGRGRGRGGMRGRGYQNRGGRGGYRGQDNATPAANAG